MADEALLDFDSLPDAQPQPVQGVQPQSPAQAEQQPVTTPRPAQGAPPKPAPQPPDNAYLPLVSHLEDSDSAAQRLSKQLGMEMGADYVVSSAGAIGRYQIMPATAARYHVTNPDDLFNPVINRRVANALLADLTKRYGDDRDAIVIAYNDGTKRADAWRAAGRNDALLPPETRGYVERERAFYQKDPTQSGGPLDFDSLPTVGPKPTQGVAPRQTAPQPQPQAQPQAPAPSPWVSTALELGHRASAAAMAISPVLGAAMESSIALLTPPPGKPGESWTGIATKAIQNVPAQLERTGGAIAQAIGESAGREGMEDELLSRGLSPTEASDVADKSGPAFQKPISPHLAAWGSKVYADANAALQANAPNFGDDWRKRAAYEISNGLVTTAPFLVAGAVTRNPAVATAGIGVIGADIYADTYGASRAAGRTPTQARMDASVSTMAQVVPMSLPLGALWRPGQTFLGKTLQSGFGWSAQTIISGLLQTAYDQGMLNDRTPWSDVLKRIGFDAGTGFVTGGIAGGVEAGMEHGAAAADTRQANQAQEHALAAWRDAFRLVKSNKQANPPAASDNATLPAGDIPDPVQTVLKSPLYIPQDMPRPQPITPGAPLPADLPQVDPEHAAAVLDVALSRSPMPKAPSLFDAIRELGGIKPGDLEGREVANILRDYKTPPFKKRLLNPDGLNGDDMRAKLQERGWFGGFESQANREAGLRPGDNMQDLYDLIDREANGEPMYPPEHPIREELTTRKMLEREMYEAGVSTSDKPDEAARKLVEFRRSWAAYENSMRNEDIIDQDLAGLPASDRERVAESGYEPGADIGAEFEETGGPEEGRAGPEDLGPLAPKASRVRRGAGEGDRAAQARAQGKPAATELNFNYEPGAVDAQGRPLPQAIIPGAERSAVQLQQAREAAGHGRKTTNVRQKEAGGLFAEPDNQGDLFAPPGAKPLLKRAEGFYSSLQRGIGTHRQEKATGDQWSGIIDNLPGVKREEVEWSGVKDWLKEQKGPVSKADVVNFLRENEVRVDEVMKGGGRIGEGRPDNAQMLEEYDRLNEAPEATTPDDQRLLHWMDDHPDATDEQFLIRKYDIWLDSHPEYPRSSADDLVQELSAMRDMSVTSPARAREINGDMAWLEDFGFRWERAQNPNPAGWDRAGYEGGTRWGAYALPGGKNYRELLLTLPERTQPLSAAARNELDLLRTMHTRRPLEGAQLAQMRNFEARENVPDVTPTNFGSSHWDEPNVLAHVRFDDRTGPNGEKILHVAEVQSDWHELGRKQGYRPSDAEVERLNKARNSLLLPLNEMLERHGDLGFDSQADARDAIMADPDAWEYDTPADKELARQYSQARLAYRAASKGRVPEAPFKTSWHELAMKRLLRYAAENGYDKLTWDTGDTNADRYDLSKRVKSITWNKETGQLQALDHNDRVREVGHYDENRLPDAVGKDAAQKLIQADEDVGGWRSIEGLDLRAGGSGMRGFYDKILPQFVSKYVKKWGGKVGTDAMPNRSNHWQGNWGPHPFTVGGVGAGYTVTDRNGESVRVPTYEDAHQYIADNLHKYMPEGKGEVPVHSVDINDRMRESVMEGQPLFQKGSAAEREFNQGYEQIGHQLFAELPQEMSPGERKAADAVERILDRIAPGAKKVVTRGLRTREGEAAHGAAFDTGGRGVLDAIAWSLGAPNVKAVARHEAVHYLRNNGLITEAEWNTLRKAAEEGDWITKHAIHVDYPGLSHEAQLEEAIADHYGLWKAAPHVVPEAIHPIFEKIGKFLASIADHFRRTFGMDATANDIFSRIESGEIGAREAAPAGGPEAPLLARAGRGARQQRQGIIDRAMREFDHFVGRRADQTRDAIAGLFMRMPDPIQEAAEAFKKAVIPMAAGDTPRYRAWAKDFAVGVRQNVEDHRRISDYVLKNFDAASRKRMWVAMDEEGVASRQNRSPDPTKGFASLDPKEYAMVKQLEDQNVRAAALAAQYGMLPTPLIHYVPRMGIEMFAGRAALLGRGIVGGLRGNVGFLGKNLRTTTPQLRKRMNMTTAETEMALEARFGRGAQVVQDILTLPLATRDLLNAVQGRMLVEKIEQLGASTGQNLVQQGSLLRPRDYFTLFPHPAFTKWLPDYVTDAYGRRVARKDQNGDTVWKAHPLYVDNSAEGPLRAVLSQDSSLVARAMMNLKGRMMSVIMFSPLMHNQVIWGRAFPAAPLKLLTPQIYKDASGWHFGIQLYIDGHKAVLDDATVREAINHGQEPIGRHFGMRQDLLGIATADNIAPGRSWLSQGMGYPVDFFSPQAGDNVRRTIDTAGNFWHNTMLWDRVRDLQMGLYVLLRDRAIAHGIDPESAKYFAAHFSNRYAGSMPMEAMSKGARGMANFWLFSRSYTLGTAGAWKDMVAGLPLDIQAKIREAAGPDGLDRIQGFARRKAATLIIGDILAARISNVMVAGAIATATYALTGMWRPNWPWNNERDKQNRVLVGHKPDGTAVYIRLGLGKTGEDLQDWATQPRNTLLRKLSPMGRAIYAVAANDQGWNRKLFDPNDVSLGGDLDATANIGGLLADSWWPVGEYQYVHDLVTNQGDLGTNIAGAALPAVGITVSRGAPGGPKVGAYENWREHQEYMWQEHKQEVMRLIQAGNLSEARREMRQLGVPVWEQNSYIKYARNPKARVNSRTAHSFIRAAPPEVRQEIHDAGGGNQ